MQNMLWPCRGKTFSPTLGTHLVCTSARRYLKRDCSTPKVYYEYMGNSLNECPLFRSPENYGTDINKKDTKGDPDLGSCG